jgi:hypothetical protein
LLDIGLDEHRDTGDRSAFWDERDYMKDVGNVHAAALIAHGNNDFNVMTKNAAQFYDALKAQNVPHQFYFHQGGHGGAPPDAMINRWFTKYCGTSRTASRTCRSRVVREARVPGAPDDRDRRPVQHGDATVADTSPFPLGFSSPSRTPTAAGHARDHQHPRRDAPVLATPWRPCRARSPAASSTSLATAPTGAVRRVARSRLHAGRPEALPGSAARGGLSLPAPPRDDGDADRRRQQRTRCATRPRHRTG